ncbi:DNA polymerase III subunit delta' [Enterobacteriaceae bacterium H11S18]|uniref:DNA polymerase III subunit delta' n=1 Tax=Dryocola clanedunensis TaxID=2925396 RepID=UPI0022F12442|nr:DNA polymerase III subunit delta' [Dryocola clanedunensis]MCT4706133.1 DNA polymerase III subunit delta' [Dryocola clanedunensis]MCT4712880.1 DNA polymerase III subunit delta' [Dryocola clanedunensis]
MKWYPWLRGPFEQILSQYQSGRGHHALLLHALPGMGDDALIYALSRWLMCQQPQGNKSCGQCRSCQLMQAGTHPDSYVIEPEKGKSSLGIDSIREITEKLYGHAQQGGAKVVWLTDAGQLTEAAANALLKTLEEPPANTWFFLGSREPERLPATLRSRCLYWYLSPPQEAFSLAWLAREISLDNTQLRAALRLSAGAPAAALDLLQPEHWKHRQALCEKLAQACSTKDMLAMLPVLNHEEATRRIQWLSSLLLDALKWQQGAGEWLANADMQPLVANLANSARPAVLQAILQGWFTCRESLLTVVGVNRELLITEQLLTWEQLMRPGAILPSPHL